MYAIIDTGSKQYRVEPGDVIDVERRPVSGKKIRKIRFDRVLLIGDDRGVQIGTPVVKEAEVTGVLVGEVRGPKIRVFKQKRRKGYRRTRGHRQDLLRVKIENIKSSGHRAARMGGEETARED